MPNLLLLIFLLQLAIHIINTLGASTINTLLWTLYLRLPSSTSSLVQKQRSQKASFVSLSSSLASTSSQDAFAKWAKIRRQLDKVTAELESTNAQLSSTRAKFDSALTILRYALLTLPRLVLQFWHTKTPLFWLPKGALPSYVEWVLALPRAPTGSVSIQVWSWACAGAVGLVWEAANGAWGLANRSGEGVGVQNGKKEPMAFESERKSKIKKEL